MRFSSPWWTIKRRRSFFATFRRHLASFFFFQGPNCMLGKRLRGCWVVFFLPSPTRGATGRLFAVSISCPLSLWLRVRQYLNVVFSYPFSCHFHAVLYMFLTSRLEVQPSQILQYCSSPELRRGAEKYCVLIAGTSPEVCFLTTQRTTLSSGQNHCWWSLNTGANCTLVGRLTASSSWV